MGCILADFDNEDFNGNDFFVNKFIRRFRKHFRDIIPLQIKERDTYKDSNDEGLYERYMALFGEYIDTDIIPEINCYLSIIDANVAEERFLNHISDVLGNPPDVFKNVEQYRNLLSYIVSVYKIKGTKEAYALFFAILGFDIEITEIEPGLSNPNYDSGRIYDAGSNLDLYDQDSCHPCSSYSIVFSYRGTGEVLLDANLLNLLRAAITFNEPINAVLDSLTLRLVIEDIMSIGIIEEIESEIVPLPYYDTALNYDEDHEHDYIPEVMALITHVIMKPIMLGDNLNLQADFSIANMPSSYQYDLNKSYVNVKLLESTQIVGEQIYNFKNPAPDMPYIETQVIESKPIPDTVDGLRLSGRIYLSNNTFYSFNETISLYQDKYINLYFNIQ